MVYIIFHYAEIVAEPYFAYRRLGVAIRFLLVLEDWSAYLLSLGLVELQQKAESEHQTALAVMAGDPLPPKPDIRFVRSTNPAPASLGPAPPPAAALATSPAPATPLAAAADTAPLGAAAESSPLAAAAASPLSAAAVFSPSATVPMVMGSQCPRDSSLPPSDSSLPLPSAPSECPPPSAPSESPPSSGPRGPSSPLVPSKTPRRPLVPPPNLRLPEPPPSLHLRAICWPPALMSPARPASSGPPPAPTSAAGPPKTGRLLPLRPLDCSRQAPP
ncbi:vegetative cell wall protein gp1-like [Xiphophorus maculatus]|uniref:vegetative cell wall protein gp1-like n=1 Tax=Xiphophorus maculatus TaxID=8083 RepID=UPI000C6ECDDB|nr:vegetative cell wall protein gp1-like [Xiphophorus maculatus]